MNSTVKPMRAALLCLACAANLSLPVWAGGDSSDGHSHGPSAPVVQAAAQTAKPHLSSQTELFELVGRLDGPVLTLYLDQFDSNLPVEKAQIEVVSGSWKASAQEVSPGVYAVQTHGLTLSGRHLLTLTVLAGDQTDLMDATLELGSPDSITTNEPASAYVDQWPLWSTATAALALAGLLVARARRRYRQP